MPIDASILLQQRPQPSLLENMGQLMQMKALLQQQQAGALQLEQQKRAIADDEGIRKLYAEDPNPSDSQIMSAGGPTRGMLILKAKREQEKANLDHTLAVLNVKKAQTEHGARILSGVTDEASYNAALPILAEILGPNAVQAMGPYDPAKVKQYIASGMDVMQQIDARIKQAEEVRKAALHPGQVQLQQSQQAEADVKAQTAGLTLAGQTVEGVANQEQYDAWRASLPAAVQARIPPMYSPAAVQMVSRMGMTPQQRASADAQAANVSESELALRAAKGDPDAAKALKTIEAHKIASRPLVNVSGAGPDDVKQIAEGIMSGNQPPDMKSLYRIVGPLRAELQRKGYNLSAAQLDWQAMQKHIATLNGPQQERLRQAINFTYDSLDIIDGLFDELQTVSKSSGFPIINRAKLAAAKQLPGKTGELATALEAQINDLTSELGTVYKGGNGSTDETLRLAAENLKANWNPEQFKRQMGLIRSNLRIRRNSINNSQPAGAREDSPYNPRPAAEPTATPTAAPATGGSRIKIISVK